MSIVTYKEIGVINDCRQLNTMECFGLIQNAIMFNQVKVINSSEINIFINTFNNLKKYIYRCIPEEKSIEFNFKSYLNENFDFYILFVPKGIEGLRINILNYTNYNKIAYIDYSIEDIEDLLL